jgi:hypothetical protein
MLKYARKGYSSFPNKTAWDAGTGECGRGILKT